MNCPVCTSPDDKIIRTETAPKGDRRRHECKVCATRWWGVERIEPGSVDVHKQSTLPLLVAVPNATNSALSTATNSVRGYSESDQRESNTPRSDPDLAGARSKPGAEFQRMVALFCERWQRSYRRPYPVSPSDRAQLGRFMREHGEYLATFAQICDRYLSDRRQFIIDRSANHTLKWLVTNGLALYGGSPRESAEQYAARIRKEHEARKRQGPSRSPELRALVMELANGKAVG